MPEKSYKVGSDVFDIPDEHVEAFLKKNPKAIEVESFISDKDTFDIPLPQVEQFIKQNPKAEPLKKKDSAGAGLSEPLGSSNKAIRAEEIVPKKKVVSGVEAIDPATQLIQEITAIPETERPKPPEFEPVESLIQKTLQESQNIQSSIVNTIDPERMRKHEEDLRRRFAESEQANKAVLTATPEGGELPQLEKQRKELEENPSYFWGTIKAINEGTASFFRTLDNAATTIEDLTGMKKGGGFGVIADYLEEGTAKLPGTPDNIVGNALEDLGHLEGMFLELSITPEFKIARLAQVTKGFVTGIPKLSTQMGASGFLNTYGELTDLNVDQQQKVLDSFAAMGHGAKEGGLLAMLGHGAGKAAQAVAKATESGVAAWATGVGVNAGGFGGLTAVEQLITEGEINMDAVRRSTVLGAALGLPGLPNALFGRAFGNYSTASPRAKVLASEIKMPLEEMRDKSADLREQAAEAKDVDAKEDLLTQADVIDNLADIKAITKDIQRDPGRYVEAIEKDENLTPEEKEYYTDQINETVAKQDPQFKKAEPISEALDKIDADIKAVEGNDKISDSVKAAKKQTLIEEKVRLTKELTDVFRAKPAEEPVPEVAKPVEEAEVKPEVPKAAEEVEPKPEEVPAEEVPVPEPEVKPEPTPEEQKTTKINRLLDLKQSFNALTSAGRTKDVEARERIIKLASELELKVVGTDRIDIKTDGKSLGRPKEALEEEFVALEGRSEKTQSFVKDVTELGKVAPETIMGIGMSKASIEQAIRNIEEGKDTKAAREFVDIMDNFVEQGYVEIRVGPGIDAQWFRMELDEFTGKAEVRQELRPEDVSDEVIESNEDLNQLISAVGNEDGTINYVKLSAQLETRPEFFETLAEGLNEAERANLKTRINEQAEEERRGPRPTPEAIEERKRLIKDLEDKAGRAKTAEEYRAVLEEAERLEAEPLAEPTPKEVPEKPKEPAPEAEPKPKEPAEPKIAEDLRKLAETIRGGKINKPGQFKASTGFDIVWDGSLEVIAKSLEAGADLAVALDKGLKHIQASDWYKELTKERQTEFDQVFEESIREQAPKEKEKAKPEGVEPTVDGEIPVVDVEVAKEGEEVSSVEAVDNMYKDQLKEFTEKRKLTFESIRKKAVTLFFDVSGNVKRKLLKEGGEEVVAEKDLIAGASAQSRMHYEDAHKKVTKGLSQREEELLASIIQSKRTIELDNIRDAKEEERLSHPKGLGKEHHEEYLANLKENNPEGYEKIEARADEYFKVMQEQLDKLNKAGLLTEEAFELLKEAQHYSPRNFIQHLDPEQTQTIEGKVISVPDSGIKSLKEGSEESLMNDPRHLMNQVISRTNARIAKNKANVALHKFVEKNPDNGFVTIQEPIGKTEAGAPKFASAPAGKTLLKAQIKGETVRMLMDSEFAEEWIRKDPLINADMANVLSVASGASVLRFMATGANPAFALTNVPRDVAHVLMLTDVYSPILPLGLAQISKDIATVFKDAITRTGRYKEYIEEGGGMEFLTQQGRILRSEAVPVGKVKRAFATAGHLLGYFNEVSEVMVRLAIREGSIANQLTEFKKAQDREPTEAERTAINRKATWTARNQMDFSQGGSGAKAVDSVIPYTNASIQGTRVLFRYATSDPKTFAAKVAQLGGVATGLYLYNSMQDGWDDISDVIKSMNFIIMTPFYTTNSDGDKEYRYITIPKSHEQIPIAGMFEGLAEWTETGKLPYKKTVRDLKLGLPSIPFITANVPILDAIRTYESNWDSFREDKIWKGKKVENWAEFNRYTPEFYKEAGELLDMSPERMKRASEKVTTNLQNNFYTNLGGMIWNQVTDGLSNDQKDEVNKTVTEQMEDALHPLLRRYLKSTNPKQKEGELERYSIEENTKRKIQNDEIKKFVNKFNKGELTRKEFKVELKEYDRADRKRLMNIFMTSIRRKGIDFWYIELKYAPSPEVKARAYFDRWKSASEDERKEMKSNARKIGGIFSKRFMATFKTLQKPYVNK